MPVGGAEAYGTASTLDTHSAAVNTSSKAPNLNHMALHFVALESKLKGGTRCAVHELALHDNAQTIRKSQRCRDLLTARSEVIVAVKATIAKNCAELRTTELS